MFDDDFTEMKSNDDGDLRRMVLPPRDAPLAMVDGEVLN